MAYQNQSYVWVLGLLCAVCLSCSDRPNLEPETDSSTESKNAGTPAVMASGGEPTSGGQPIGLKPGGSVMPPVSPMPTMSSDGGAMSQGMGGIPAMADLNMPQAGMEVSPTGGMPSGGVQEQPAMPTAVERFTRRRIDLPFIYDFSGAPQAHVDGLIRRAIDGLGFEDGTGPSALDRVFVNRHFIAWIDETGFYGKMNALWPLNGNPDDLDFVMLEGRRPVNAFIVAERGDGQWPAGYMGSEHIEFPNHVPEDDDNPDCRDSFCGQYAHGEAHRISVDAILDGGV